MKFVLFTCKELDNDFGFSETNNFVELEMLKIEKETQQKNNNNQNKITPSDLLYLKVLRIVLIFIWVSRIESRRDELVDFTQETLNFATADKGSEYWE